MILRGLPPLCDALALAQKYVRASGACAVGAANSRGAGVLPAEIRQRDYLREGKHEKHSL